MSKRPIKRALVSVYDKSGLEELGAAFAAANVEVVSTGSTAARLREFGVPVTPVEELTGFPECLDGRVKTLHPKVHAGILADLRLDDHVKQLEELDIEAFDLVVVNLYPFAETVASGAAPDECIEQIDIGGPTMVRAAAKNHPSVAVVVDPATYPQLIAAITGEGFTLDERRSLAALAFQHTASYDIAVASWLGFFVAPPADDTGFPPWLAGEWNRTAVLRYGENPHQKAALFSHGRGGLAAAEQLHGPELSYNNYVDTDAARRAAADFDAPCVAIIKHANPCGIAVGDDIAIAHLKAYNCDPVSAYGGVIAANRTVTKTLAEQLSGVLTEVICAPDYEPEALEIFKSKQKLRVLKSAPATAPEPVEWRPISGGLLMQTVDHIDAPGDDPATWELKAGSAADVATLSDLSFAWRACRSVKSNAILLAADGATVGVGMGQVNRIDSCKLALSRAGDRARGSVAASDAFFPFADGLQILIDAGVRAVVEPGGSIRDDEAVAAAEAAGITLYFSGTRHFFH